MTGISCPSCAAPAPDGSRFCPSCGAALAEAGAGERRLATILFADLVGSTSLTVGLDPEDARALLTRYFDVARAVLEDHGGTLEKFVGDAVLAAFGVPRSHGDDPDRAVRAGLDLARRVAELGPNYAVRVGISTGEVLVAGTGGDLDLTGEAVNSAARIEQAAQTSQVLVDERTARACQVAELRPAKAVDAKGFGEPIEVHEALAGERDARALLDTPLIGRADDVALLELLVRRAFSSRAPALVTIVGEAGLGKSRVLAEVLSRLSAADAAPRVLTGRSPSYGHGVAFWAVGEVLREVADAAPVAAAEEVLGALERRLAELGAQDAGVLAADLAVAVGVAESADAAPAAERVRRAWRRMLGLLAADRPLVLALDDVHWADEGTLDLIEDSLLGAGALPLAVICTARPELLERRPAWTGGLTGSGAVHLAPLDGDDAYALATVLLRETGNHADRELTERIVQLAAGNPFFAEELACSPTLTGSGAALPDSVQGVVSARLDQLPDEQRQTLQAAAVLGVRFSAEGVSALVGGDPLAPLDGLARSAVIVAEPQAGPGFHAFRHQILRDVAYGTLPRQARAVLHERAAEWTAATAGDRLPELAEIVAYHRERAAELTGDDARRRTAADDLIAAAWQAALRGAVEQADALFERAAAIAPDPPLAIRAHREAAEAAVWARMRGDLAAIHLRRAADLAAAAGETFLEAIALARLVELSTRFTGMTGPPLPPDELDALLSRAAELAVGGDAQVQARVALAETWKLDMDHVQNTATPDAARQLVANAERACELARVADDPVLISSALDALDAAHLAAGRPAAGVAATLQRRTLRSRLTAPGAPAAEWFDALTMIAEGLGRLGQFDEAFEAASEARAAELGRGLEHTAYSRLFIPLFELGRWDEVGQELQLFRAGWEAAGRPPAAFAREPLASAIAVLALRGDVEGGTEWLAVWDRLGGTQQGADLAWPGPCALVIAQARTALQQRRPDDAAELLARDPEEINGWLRGRYAAQRAEADVRRGVPAADATIARAQALVEEDRFAEAVLARARALHDGDAGALLASHAAFVAAGARYEAARTAVDLGGPHAEAGRAALAALGIPD